MTVSPKKLNPVKSRTVNRGVEAKDIKECDTPIDLHRSIANHRKDASGAGDSGRGGSQSPSVLSASYVQVLVQKHQRPPARLPVTSSPNKHVGTDERIMLVNQFVPVVYQCQSELGRLTSAGPGDCGPSSSGPGTVLFSCPALAALHQQTCGVTADVQTNVAGAGDRADAPEPRLCERTGKTVKELGKPIEKKERTFWNKLNGHTEQIDGPDRIEVYHFGHDCGVLCARGCRETHVERSARSLGRRAATLFDELLAVPRLMLQLPVSILLRVQSCLLLTVRGAVAGVVQTASDQLLKPALALLFDALLRPPLLCAARLAGALRDAARPLWLALGDALEPLAHLLGQIRLVTVENKCVCERAV